MKLTNYEHFCVKIQHIMIRRLQ